MCTITPLQYVHRMLCYSLDFHMWFALEHRVDSSSQLSHCNLFFFLLFFLFSHKQSVDSSFPIRIRLYSALPFFAHVIITEKCQEPGQAVILSTKLHASDQSSVFCTSFAKLNKHFLKQTLRIIPEIHFGCYLQAHGSQLPCSIKMSLKTKPPGQEKTRITL